VRMSGVKGRVQTDPAVRQGAQAEFFAVVAA
jgi:hypothetical protein